GRGELRRRQGARRENGRRAPRDSEGARQAPDDSGRHRAALCHRRRASEASMTLTLAEYAAHDALGLAALVESRQVSPKELALAAAAAIAALNPALNAVVETYADRIDGLDERTLGDGPFRGVPFLIKDVFGQEAGRRIEWGSRLCRGMVAQQNTYLFDMLRASGVNILGRSATPEYSMSGTTESAMFGNTS